MLHKSHLSSVPHCDHFTYLHQSPLDLYRVISTYADAGNEDRLYDPGSPHMEKFNYDPESAGAALAGEDSRMLSNAATVTKLRTLLATADSIDTLAERNPHFSLALPARKAPARSRRLGRLL